jgi:hypothetical protein
VALFLAALALHGTACRPNGALASAATPASGAPHEDSALNHFWFDYRGQPDPGRRVWIRTKRDIWAELYPNGTVSRYKRSGPTLVNGESGTTVQRIAGDVRRTFTANDGSFEVFIPDNAGTGTNFFEKPRSSGESPPRTRFTTIS